MKILRYAAFVGIVAAPLFVAAQTTSNSNVSALLAELSALEQQINSLTNGSSTVSSAPTPSSPNQSLATNLCPDLSRSLSVGASGADVAGLQEFLAQKGLFHAVITGYFGDVTESAVAAWQEQNGVVSGGDAGTTGLGVVGPKTRSTLESLCQSSPSAPAKSQCMQTLPPSTECPTGWQPQLDSNGCTMYYQCSIALPNATSTTSTAATSATACPVAQKPTCSGTVVPFQTSSGGCVTAYECVL